MAGVTGLVLDAWYEDDGMVLTCRGTSLIVFDLSELAAVFAFFFSLRTASLAMFKVGIETFEGMVVCWENFGPIAAGLESVVFLITGLVF